MSEQSRQLSAARQEVYQLLADAYSFVHGVEEVAYLSQMPLDQMIDQAIQQLGAPPDMVLGLETSAPPAGTTSRRQRILRLRDEFNRRLEAMKSLPDMQSPLLDQALIASFGEDADG